MKRTFSNTKAREARKARKAEQAFAAMSMRPRPGKPQASTPINTATAAAMFVPPQRFVPAVAPTSTYEKGLGGVVITDLSTVRAYGNYDLFDTLNEKVLKDLDEPPAEYSREYERERNMVFLTSILTLNAKDKLVRDEMHVLLTKVQDLTIEIARIKSAMKRDEVSAWERMMGETQMRN